MKQNQIDQYQLYRETIPVLVTTVLSLMVSLTPLWQLTIIAALFGGLFCTTMKRGALTGTVGVGFAWFTYMLMNPIHTLLNQFGTLVIGQDMGWLVLLIIFLVGSLFGFLGGSLGAGIRMLAFPPNRSLID
ncbi:MAG: hypothetical protein ACFFE8_16505 [Candidatus Heimdallarchaeota archaeon]